MKRYESLKVIASLLKGDELAVVALGGMIDEWYSLKPGPESLYLKIMGTITPVAFGLSRAIRDRKILSLDTDGSLLLNLGILCTIGNEQPENLITIVMDNACYEVIGGPPTHTYKNVDLAAMAKGAGIRNSVSVETIEECEREVKKALQMNEPSVIVARIEKGTEVFPEKQRKRTDGIEDKYRFVRFIEDEQNVTIIPREVKSVRKIESKHNWQEK